MSENDQRNVSVTGDPLEICSVDPMTGFYRTGTCASGPEDIGCHAVCSIVTTEFLEYSKLRGNDLSTPRPEFEFPGLKPGDRWCVCAERWHEAWQAGVAPAVVLEATHIRALEAIPKSVLEEHAHIGESSQE